MLPRTEEVFCVADGRNGRWRKYEARMEITLQR